MATGMREKTTNVGGIIKRIWYAMTGTTQGAELMSIDDTGKFKCVSEQISGLAGTGSRMVIADATGNLSTIQRLNTISVTGLTTSYQLTTMPAVNALSYIWKFTSSNGVAIIESTHNLYAGKDFLSQFLGCTVIEVTPNLNYSFRLGDSVIEIGVDNTEGNVYLKRNSGTVTDLTIERLIQNAGV